MAAMFVVRQCGLFGSTPTAPIMTEQTEQSDPQPAPPATAESWCETCGQKIRPPPRPEPAAPAGGATAGTRTLADELRERAVARVKAERSASPPWESGFIAAVEAILSHPALQAPAAIAAEGAGELLDVCKAYLNFQTCPRCQAGEMCDDCADAYNAIHERAKAAIAAAGGNAGE